MLKYQKLQTNVSLIPCITFFLQKALRKNSMRFAKRRLCVVNIIPDITSGPLKHFRLFETISTGKYLIHGFTNQEIRRYNNPDTVNECGKMTRSFAKLCAHRLIRKIPHSRRYMVSDKGTSCHVCNH